MDPLGEGVAAVAAALGFSGAIRSLRGQIDDGKLGRMLVELIRQGSLDRARKTCRSAPEEPIVAAAAAGIEATVHVDAELGRAQVADVLDHAMTRELAARQDRRSRFGWFGPAALLLGVASLALSYGNGLGALSPTGLAACIGMVCGAYSSLNDVRSRFLADRVVPAIRDALIDHVMQATRTGPRAGSPAGGEDVEAISQSLGLRPIRDITPTPARVTSTFDMRSGTCGMCGHDELATVVRGPLKAFVCKSCGFAQWFADDASALDA